MAYVPLSRFLFRAPLLPLRDLWRGRRDGGGLLAHPLGAAAISLASPDLAAGLGRTKRPQVAVDRYHRRAAFRPTPHGLLAGVGIGSLAARSSVRTGSPAAVLRLSWSRLADLGRALATWPDARAQARLRRAPSVLVGPHTVVWLGPGVDGALVEERHADIDDVIAAVLDAARDWTPWGSLGTVIDADAEEADDLLGAMVEDGLLHVDLVPPLVGPDPADWMRDRLAAVPALGVVSAGLASARAAADRGDLPAANQCLAALPGAAAPGPDLDATLVFPDTAPFTLSRGGVERAATLAPLLFRLAEALVPPVAERTPAPVLADALEGATAIFGAGALDLGAFALGEYGVNPGTDHEDAGHADVDNGHHQPRQAQNPAPAITASATGEERALVTLLIDRITDAARNGSEEVALDAQELETVLPPVRSPSTCELFVTPCGARPGRPPGHGWLVGLHGPAGASWGRFAFALGESAPSLLAPLLAAEREGRPGEETVDVVFAPSDALGDICAHPRLRPRALAVSGWPADDASAVTAADLELCADPAALEPLALRTDTGRGAQTVAPSPLHRVRSSTAPPGIWRLLIGWNLQRQHAPWAMTLGPLGDLAWTPRMSIDGFVVAPASWRIPPALGVRGRSHRASRRALDSWRQAAQLPRFVQVGSGDELLPVDLRAPNAAGDLVGRTRVFEIWPPLGDTPDKSGRRVEAVIALVDRPAPDELAEIEMAIGANAAAGKVPPPRRTAETRGAQSWQTFKLFATRDRQDPFLVDVIAPLIADARRAGEISGWFFLRYVDGPGQRHHLRLRVRPPAPDDAHPGEPGAFARRLEAGLAMALATADVVAVENAWYFPEAARYGGEAALPAVHQLFEADSDLACALLAIEADQSQHSDLADAPDIRQLFLVMAFDATAGALGLDASARQALARRRRAAHGPDVSEDLAAQHQQSFRTLGPHLRRLLGGGAPSPVARALRDHQARARRAVATLGTDMRARILPALLHLCAVRLAGLDRGIEAAAYTYWDRTLESLGRHPF